MLTWTTITNDIYACDVGFAYIKNREIVVLHLDHQLPKDKFPTTVADVGNGVNYTVKYTFGNLVHF